MEEEKELKLFNNFTPVTTEEWEAKINADLKGQDYERALVWKTYEGFNVRPYYRRENVESLRYLDSLPGEFPFVRGNNKDNNEWFVRQDIQVTDFETANKKALSILGKGVNSIGFIFDSCNKMSKNDLTTLLKDIYVEAIEINFVCNCDNFNCATEFAKLITEGNYNNNKVVASASIDPIASFVLRGKLEPTAFENLKTVIEKTRELKHFRVIGVNGKIFANSGSSIVQELAFSLAQGVEYLTQLTELGLSVDEVAKNIKFNFGIGNSYFMEIAKLRAARLLWAKIIETYCPKCNCSAKMIAHSETNTYNKTIYDPYVNMLRTQTEAMSAALGGAHSIAVLPFNAVYENTTEFSERIARNQQLLLKEESHFNKIVDPSAGSYYIESLTDSLTEHAWKLFLEIQEKGGFIAAFKEGVIQDTIKTTAAKRDQNIALRRDNILGTNQFPNFAEKLPDKEIKHSVFEPVDLTVEGAKVTTLKPYRGAQAFEALRHKTDIYSINNKRPVVFMLTIGNLAMRKARAQFSCNFFAVAGFDVIDNNGFTTAEEGVAAAKAKNADIVVVCSSDDEYEIAPKIAELLNNEILVIAGNPACKAELESKGITNFIHVRSNILEDLREYQSKLGI